MSKKVCPRFDREQLKVIDSIKGFGKNRTERVKNMVLAWMSEHKKI
jgi:hypothetical protein